MQYDNSGLTYDSNCIWTPYIYYHVIIATVSTNQPCIVILSSVSTYAFIFFVPGCFNNDTVVFYDVLYYFNQE